MISTSCYAKLQFPDMTLASPALQGRAGRTCSRPGYAPCRWLLAVAARSVKLIMLFDGAADVPGAGHPDGKGDEIPLADLHRLPALWRHDHLPLQDITSLRAVVAP